MISILFILVLFFLGLSYAWILTAHILLIILSVQQQKRFQVDFLEFELKFCFFSNFFISFVFHSLFFWFLFTYFLWLWHSILATPFIRLPTLSRVPVQVRVKGPAASATSCSPLWDSTRDHAHLIFFSKQNQTKHPQPHGFIHFLSEFFMPLSVHQTIHQIERGSTGCTGSIHTSLIFSIFLSFDIPLAYH